MSSQFKVKIKLHISLFLIKYQLQVQKSYRCLPVYLQLIIKQNLVFTKLIHLIFKTQKYVIDSYSLNVCINIIYVERITCLGVAPCDPSSRISRDSVQLLIKSSWNETLIGLMPMAGRFHMKIYFKTEISVSYNCIHVPIRIL